MGRGWREIQGEERGRTGKGRKNGSKKGMERGKIKKERKRTHTKR